MTTSDSKHNTPDNYTLPWLVNGTLTGKEKEEQEAALANSDALRQDKAFLDALRTEVKAQALPHAPKELGWQRLKRDMHQAPSAPANNYWRFAAIAASLIVVVQATLVTLPGLQQEDNYQMMSAGPEHVLQVRFTEQAGMTEINQLLLTHNLRIIDGPSSAGLYTLSAATDADLQAELKTLRLRSDLVEHAQVD